METTKMNPNEHHEEEETRVVISDEEVEQLKQSLPKELSLGKIELIKYQGFWYPVETDLFKSSLMFQRHFIARDSDLIVASFPKTGTTWLKALLYSVVNRFKRPSNQSPFLIHHPHELVHRLENDIYGEAFEYPRPHHLSELPSPRLFHTHLPFTTLPETIKASGYRVLYIARNPLDTIVSFMLFALKPLKKILGEDFQPTIQDFFEELCAGRICHGPFFEHVVEYWKQSLEQPNKMLFLKYEDLKEDPTFQLKRVAEFVGMPFSCSEESEGVVEELVEMCSINNLKELEVNKTGVINKIYDKKSYFRKGEVGDWSHYITPTMAERMKKLMEEKLEGTGLSFQLLPH
ncbi:cytosolic sulfotransferase 5-like [Chenopodium quinoa]|uniref:cytosolic sulfotransferase 5-like n=1 Tax=Chenopodium quinoa TaxID=63459 RepID=UPI000B78846D|nr:cytosolic sulfotransferase 5-like [Chenopodium quinoa]